MEQDTGQKPAATAEVLKTHTNKTGTCIDKRAHALVANAEALALERSQSSSLTEGTVSTLSNHDLTAAYIETATNTKGRIYGLGSIQYPSCHLDETADTSILRQSSEAEEKEQMKNCVKELKTGMELLLKLNGYDHVTYQPVACESTASAPSPRSEAIQQPNMISDTLPVGQNHPQ